MAIILFLVLWLLTFALWLLGCRLGLTWAKVSQYKFGQILLAALVSIVGTGVINAIFMALIAKSGMPPSIALPMGLFVNVGLWVAITVLAISYIIRVPLRPSFLIAMPTFLAPVVTLLLTMFVVKPFLLEAYVVPASSMSPTILGRHVCSVCEECGAPRYGSASLYRPGILGGDDVEMICENFHVTKSPPPDPEVFPGDRVMVAKWKKPKRWDIIVFKYPNEPEVPYVKRLVGLPGETITIEGGAVYADGKKLELPPNLQGLTYVDHFEDSLFSHGPHLWGHVDKPAILGEDEYFVLGDFTTNSSDSRLWRDEYDDTHHPYAVPADHLIGVVSEIYWPASRWRSFP
ncbi:signal peptidase I [Bremerella cremea]|uniref:Signal peptidase I n=1 Tax=Bremerella cremea TaxID=1031537 RepID=A0A368KTB7_9BACT|nr:signal peptidase I [Bremerella cremea]